MIETESAYHRPILSPIRNAIGSSIVSRIRLGTDGAPLTVAPTQVSKMITHRRDEEDPYARYTRVRDPVNAVMANRSNGAKQCMAA